jgi:DNA (cytosine-5)-methyltransferase 1
MKTVTRKIGSNKGRPRLWIEGAHLVAAGFARGDNWTLRQTRTGLVIDKDVEGSRRVSGKGDRPVIDIMGASLGVLAEGFERAKLTYRPAQGLIIIEGASE